MPMVLLRKRMHIDHVVHSVLLGEGGTNVSWYEQEDILLFGPFLAAQQSPLGVIKALSLDTPVMWGRAVYHELGECMIVDAMNEACAIDVWEPAMLVSRYYYSPWRILSVLKNEVNIKHRMLLINLVVEKIGQMGEYCPRWKYEVRGLIARG